MTIVNRLKTKQIKSRSDISQAESVAAEAFAFLAAEPEYFSRFSAVTGLNIGDIAEISGTRGFLAAVLEYVVSDESLLLSFCENHGHLPEVVDRASVQLAGGPDC